MLPNNPTNQERLEWLAAVIRRFAGDASIVMVHSIDNLSAPQLIARFTEARVRDYQMLIRELHALSSIPAQNRAAVRLSRLKERFHKIVAIDFFDSPLQKRVTDLIARADHAPTVTTEGIKVRRRDYIGKVWVTRPRPGIDRSASAWLIRSFIDRRARFKFASEPNVPRGAVPFDMFRAGGFGHRGEDCTFETLQKSFRVRGRSVEEIGQIIHDADLLDEKFGRKEGFGIDKVLDGWAKLGIADSQLLNRGMQLIQALYHSVSDK